MLTLSIQEQGKGRGPLASPYLIWITAQKLKAVLTARLLTKSNPHETTTTTTEKRN